MQDRLPQDSEVLPEYVRVVNIGRGILRLRFGTNPREYELHPGDDMLLVGDAVYLAEARTIELPEYPEEG